MWRADSLEKDPDAGKDWSQKEKGAEEDEMVRQHHWHGHEYTQLQEIVKDRRAWRAAVHGGRKESDMT